MLNITTSSAANGLLRALFARSGVSREQVLLTEMQSVDWQSLTFSGERHVIRLRVPGPRSAIIAASICDGLEDAEFTIAGHIVADICVMGTSSPAPDGSTTIAIEALTIVAD